MRSVRALRAFAEVTLGRQRSPQHENGSFMVPYLRAANVKDGTLDLSDVKTMNFTPDEQRSFGLWPGDVLVSEGSGSLRTVGASAVWSGEINGVVCFQNTLLRLRPRSKSTDSRFLAWWARHAFASGLFAGVATGANIYHISAERVRAIPVSFPNVFRQREVADFLDAETTRIYELIAKKRRMVNLVRTRFDLSVRQALGDPSWPPLPLKRRWTVIDCKHRTPTYAVEGIPVVSPGDTTPGRLDLSRCHRFVDTTDYQELTAGGRRPRRGDIIYSRNASVGIASYVDTDKPFCMGQDVCLIRSDDQDQRFLTYALNTFGLDQLELTKVGSTFTRINVAQISQLQIPCPKIEVQRHVADHLDQLTSTVGQITVRLHRQIGLLQEHCQALITSAVTGQLDIPGVVA